MQFGTKTPSTEIAEVLNKLGSNIIQWRYITFEALQAYRKSFLSNISLSEMQSSITVGDRKEETTFKVKHLTEKFIDEVSTILIQNYGKTESELSCLKEWAKEWWIDISNNLK